MSLPAPAPGLVIRYSFLWSHEAQQGIVEGRKDRPAAIIVATQKDNTQDIRVIVAAITHAPPPDPRASREIPTQVVQSLGLDQERQWVRLDELNRFSWPGFDLRQIPGRSGEYAYGMLPLYFYNDIRSAILKLQEKKSTKTVVRDVPSSD